MTDYERLKGIIDEIDVLIQKNVTASAPDFTAWHTKVERFLAKRFGEDSIEYSKFQKTHFSLIIATSRTTEAEFIQFCKESLLRTKAVFNIYLEEMVEEDTVAMSTPIKSQASFSKIFIVHGHDGELRQAVARIIENQNIEAIILSEKANLGRTIIEKFEDYSDVDGAICLFTSDDIGKAKKDDVDKPRARQNVVLETGYFMGKLGRNHIVILADSGIEMPSDLSGVVYTDTANWQIDLLKELKAIGYTVDFNKLFK